jgi:glycosyltransferase involved in cell wall biosynthesis
MNKIHLSVVIPSYNEKVNLRKGVLDKIDHYLSRQRYSWEVIIVDDGSTDGSFEFCEAFVKDNKNFRVIKGAHSGKAGAVTKGILEAKGEIRLFTDMDQATPIEEVEKLLPLFEDGYDIVIGSRTERVGSPMSRRVMSKSMIILRKMTVGITEIHDTQCGFKMFTAEAAKNLFTKLSGIHNGYSQIHGSNVTAGFDVELLLLASKLGYLIKEVPVEWLYVESRRVSPIKDSINGVLDLLEISSNRLTGKYNL